MVDAARARRRLRTFPRAKGRTFSSPLSPARTRAEAAACITAAGARPSAKSNQQRRSTLQDSSKSGPKCQCSHRALP
eukprot:14201143-Alexandrium_andersonii.AAC.1